MRLPRDLSGRALVAVLTSRFGYYLVHRRGSHVVLETVEPSKHRIAVPDHGELRIGTLNSVLRATRHAVDLRRPNLAGQRPWHLLPLAADQAARLRATLRRGIAPLRRGRPIPRHAGASGSASTRKTTSQIPPSEAAAATTLRERRARRWTRTACRSSRAPAITPPRLSAETRAANPAASPTGRCRCARGQGDGAPCLLRCRPGGAR